MSDGVLVKECFSRPRRGLLGARTDVIFVSVSYSCFRHVLLCALGL